MIKFNYIGVMLSIAVLASCTLPPVAIVTRDKITVMGGGSLAENTSGETKTVSVQTDMGTITFDSSSQTKDQTTSVRNMGRLILGLEGIKATTDLGSDAINKIK